MATPSRDYVSSQGGISCSHWLIWLLCGEPPISQVVLCSTIVRRCVHDCLSSPSRDLANDVLTLMSSSKPYLRKKGILTMYKVFVKFPDALRPAFPRLKERLEDPDPGEEI